MLKKGLTLILMVLMIPSETSASCQESLTSCKLYVTTLEEEVAVGNRLVEALRRQRDEAYEESGRLQAERDAQLPFYFWVFVGAAGALGTAAIFSR